MEALGFSVLTHSRATCHSGMRATVAASHAGHPQGARGKDVVRQVCVAGAPSLHSVNEWTEAPHEIQPGQISFQPELGTTLLCLDLGGWFGHRA